MSHHSKKKTPPLEKISSVVLFLTSDEVNYLCELLIFKIACLEWRNSHIHPCLSHSLLGILVVENIWFPVINSLWARKIEVLSYKPLEKEATSNHHTMQDAESHTNHIYWQGHSQYSASMKLIVSGRLGRILRMRKGIHTWILYIITSIGEKMA